LIRFFFFILQIEGTKTGKPILKKRWREIIDRILKRSPELTLVGPQKAFIFLQRLTKIVCFTVSVEVQMKSFQILSTEITLGVKYNRNCKLFTCDVDKRLQNGNIV
jgi:hypothetical protein